MSKQIGRSIDLNIEAEKRKTRTAARRRFGEPFCRGVFPCGEYEPCSSPCQGRMIAGAITREPASLRTGRTLTEAAPQLMRQPRGKSTKAAHGRLFSYWERVAPVGPSVHLPAGGGTETYLKLM